MATPTLVTMRDRMGFHMLDEDTVDPGIATTRRTEMLNDAYQDLLALYPELLTATVGTVAFDSSTFAANVTGSVNFRKLLEAINLAGTVGPLERVSWAEMQRLQMSEATTALSLKYWAAEKSATNYKTWTITVYPILSGAATETLTIKGEKEPVDLAADADVPVCGTEFASWIVRLAAWRGCAILGGRDEQMRMLSGDLPEKIRAAFNLVEGAKRPRAAQGNKSGV